MEVKDSLADMKTNLTTTIETLDSAIVVHRKKMEDASKLAEAWLARFLTARKALMVTENPDAINSLTILSTQAKQYALAYAAVQDDEKKKEQSLGEQKTKLSEALTRIDILEKSKALNAQLKKISARVDMPVVDAGQPDIDTREVSLIIHTAQALIELNGGKDSNDFPHASSE